MTYKTTTKGSCDKLVEFNCPNCTNFDEGFESETITCTYCGNELVPSTRQNHAIKDIRGFRGVDEGTG